jgi:hypothetical protein
MSVFYDGVHSITMYLDTPINSSGVSGATIINTWTDLHLIPSSRPILGIPAPNITLVSVPGSNNVLDLSEILTGKILFGRRSGSWEFLIDHDRWNSWLEAYYYISNMLNGKAVGVQLQGDTYIYKGRLTVKEWKNSASYSGIAIDYDLCSGYGVDEWPERVYLLNQKSVTLPAYGSITMNIDWCESRFFESTDHSCTEYLLWYGNSTHSQSDSIYIQKGSNTDDLPRVGESFTQFPNVYLSNDGTATFNISNHEDHSVSFKFDTYARRWLNG